MRSPLLMLAAVLGAAHIPILPFEEIVKRQRKTSETLKRRVKQSDAAVSAAQAKRERRAAKLRALEGK